MDEDPAVERIADALRRYVRGRPKAGDSARGIRQWWLADMEPAPTPGEVEAALRLLQEEGSFIWIPLEDGSELWRPAPGAA